MMKMFKKNKILFIVAAIVLFGGASLAVVLISNADVAMAAQQIKTVAAEASESAAADVVTPTPQPVAVSATPASHENTVDTALSADALSHLVQSKEMRRDYVIPSLDNTVVNQADTWKISEPANFDALKPKALSKATDFAKSLFGYDIKNNVVAFRYFTDTSGNRGDFIRVYTTDEAVVCTLTVDTLDLINIDYYFIPAKEQTATDFDYKTTSDSDRQIADKVAAVFGTKVSKTNPAGGGGGKGIWTKVYNLALENGKLVKFAVMNGELYAVGVYPSQACMVESAYFDADVQWQPSIVKPASEQSFKKGEQDAGDMTKDDALKFYMSFMILANGDGEYDQPKMTFYIDKSGVRENYWHMESKKLTMDLSSKSKWIVSLTCGDLVNSGYDLTKVNYDSMGGKEYENYVGNIMSGLYGNGLKEVKNNAVYDDHYCTEDAWMTDGSVYEFMFKDGKLQQVFYYANEECFKAGLANWKADNEYINSTTGETFIPD